MWSVISGGTGGLNISVGLISNRKEKLKILAFREIPQFPPLVRHPNLLIRKSPRKVVGVLAVIILKRVSESFFFQSNKLTACKVKDGKRGDKFFDDIRSTEDYPFILKLGAFKDLVKFKLQPTK